MFIKKLLIEIVESSRLPAKRACNILGLSTRRLFRWEEKLSKQGVFGLNDKPPAPKYMPHSLMEPERKEIISYTLDHPKEHHREIQFNLDRLGLAHVSFSSVYRRLKAHNLIKEHRFLKASKEHKKTLINYVHQIWGLDITYIPVNGGFYYLIAVIDLYSRYIVGWELCPTMTGDDVKRVLDFTLLKFGFHDKEEKPIVHSDNGTQMKAHSLKQLFVNLSITREFSRPHTPEDQAIVERFFCTLKQEEVYRSEYESIAQARNAISDFINYYNHRRPHLGIGFVTPYQLLTGQREQVIKERKQRLLLAQKTRKLENKNSKKGNAVPLEYPRSCVYELLVKPVDPAGEGEPRFCQKVAQTSTEQEVQEPEVLRNEFAKV